MKHKNIIHILWDDSYAVEQDLKGLEKIFEEKYGALNIEHHNLSDFKNFPIETLTASDLFSEKKLFIFRGSQPKENARRKEKDETRIEHVLDKIHENIPENTVIIFAFLGAEEKKLKSWLKKNATLREKKFSWDLALWEARTSLSQIHVKKIISLYKQHESMRDKYDSNPLLSHDIIHSIEMAERLVEWGNTLDNNTLESIINGYEGGQIFPLIDSIISGNTQDSIQKLEKFKGSDAKIFYPFLNNLLSNLRKNVYIITLRDLGKSQKMIEEITGAHSFVVQKAYRSPLSKEKIADFYKKILLQKIAYQRWKWMKESELWLFFEIELALLNLKK